MSILVFLSSRWEKREQVALLCLSSWCLVIVVWLFITMTQVCLQFVIVVFPDHTHLLFCIMDTISQKVIIKVTALFPSRACNTDMYISISYGKVMRNT